MSNWSMMKITNAGLEMQAKVQAGRMTMQFTKMAIGAGTLPEGESAEKMTALNDWRRDVGISGSAYSNENRSLSIRATITNAGIVEAYKVTEMGLFAWDNEAGKEILYAVFFDDTPDLLPTENIRAIVKPFTVTLGINSTENISVKMDMTSMATLQDVYDARISPLDIYPVGSVYISMTPTNPGKIFGGTWEEMPAGRMMIGAGKADSGTVYTAGQKGGEERHQLLISELPAHNHGGQTSTDGNHTHTQNIQSWAEGGVMYGNGTIATGSDGFEASYQWTCNAAGSHTHKIATAGSGSAHNNMSPFFAVYMWQRTE